MVWRQETALMEFERIRGGIFALHVCLAMMGAAFLVDVLQNSSPITPELYGARVHAIDAWIWASLQFGSCGIAAVGAMWGGKTGAVLTLVGATVSSFMFAFLARMAMDADQGTLIFYGSTFLTTPLATLSGLSAFNRIWGRDD